MSGTSTAGVRLISLMLCLLFLNHNSLCNQFGSWNQAVGDWRFGTEEAVVDDHAARAGPPGPAGPGPQGYYPGPPPPSEGDRLAAQIIRGQQEAHENALAYHLAAQAQNQPPKAPGS